MSRRPLKSIKTGQLPEIGYVRLPQVLSVFPVGKSTFWNMVRDGRAPKPVHLSQRTVAWRASDIRAFLAEIEKDNENRE